MVIILFLCPQVVVEGDNSGIQDVFKPVDLEIKLKLIESDLLEFEMKLIFANLSILHLQISHL